MKDWREWLGPLLAVICFAVIPGWLFLDMVWEMEAQDRYRWSPEGIIKQAEIDGYVEAARKKAFERGLKKGETE